MALAGIADALARPYPKPVFDRALDVLLALNRISCYNRKMDLKHSTGLLLSLSWLCFTTVEA